jgi:hypothetical protein
LRVPVTPKRAVGPGGVERGFELGLPGTTVTTLNLELPPAVKELRWNDTLEKTRTNNRWLLSLGRAKTLSLSWREPVTASGSGPLLTAEGQVTVRLDEAQVGMTAELTLEDLRGQTKEWRLLLPAQAKVEIKAPAGATYELVPPAGNEKHHVLKLAEPSAERWGVSVLTRTPRPAAGGRFPIGPFFVEGAYRQQGTITVQVAPDAARRQRLLYHRLAEVFQRDLPKTPAAPDVEAVFQYWSLPARTKKTAGGVPLELELRTEKSPLETTTDTTLRLRPAADGWELELALNIQAKAPYGGDYLDVQMPRRQPRNLLLLGVAGGGGYPASLPWPALWQARGQPAAWAEPVEFHVLDESGAAIEVPPADAQGRTRVPLPRAAAKSFALQIHGRYLLPPQNQRARVGLPRLVGVTERGSKLAVQADDAVELLLGAKGNEEPAPEKHRYQVAGDETPAVVDVAWRTYRP